MQTDPTAISFCLSSEQDRSSFALDARILGQKKRAELLPGRLPADGLANAVGPLRRNHLSKSAYHTISLVPALQATSNLQTNTTIQCR